MNNKENYKYPWVYSEEERRRVRGCRCYDCKLYYGKDYPDMVLPNDLWVEISPTGDEGGLLCPTCIANRLDHLGLWYEPGFFLLTEESGKSWEKINEEVMNRT